MVDVLLSGRGSLVGARPDLILRRGDFLLCGDAMLLDGVGGPRDLALGCADGQIDVSSLLADDILRRARGLIDGFRDGLLSASKLSLHRLRQYGMSGGAKLGLELLGQVLGVDVQPRGVPATGQPRLHFQPAELRQSLVPQVGRQAGNLLLAEQPQVEVAHGDRHRHVHLPAGHRSLAGEVQSACLDCEGVAQPGSVYQTFQGDVAGLEGHVVRGGRPVDVESGRQPHVAAIGFHEHLDGPLRQPRLAGEVGKLHSGALTQAPTGREIGGANVLDPHRGLRPAESMPHGPQISVGRRQAHQVAGLLR